MIRLLALCLLCSAAVHAEEPEPPKRVVYVPESVKEELREEIKQEVMKQAKEEGWAAPGLVQTWLSRLKFNGDVRLRFERDLFSRGNANAGEFPDFNAINTNKPFDINPVDPSNDRYLDVDQDRTRPRLRARLGVDADVTHGFSAGFRFASGESSNPGSANQTLGNSGSDFSKYQFWIDRAFVRYTHDFFSVTAGRFDNPFFNTEMLWSPDVNLDGAVAQASARDGVVRPFATAGAFPLYTTPFAFPADHPDKSPQRNRWLYAAQIGGEVRSSQGVSFKLAAAFFDFDKVEGRLGAPCDTNLSFISCEGDDSRPSFAQKGNTYLALRTPTPQALLLESTGTASRYEFFGLASRFRELVGTARLEVPATERTLFTAEAEYVHNAGFNKAQISGFDQLGSPIAVNNRGAVTLTDKVGPYAGGPDGFQARLSLGSRTQEKQWDWRVRVLYRYLESDAVLDALNDQDFGLGGTNLKGYAVDFTVWLADGISFNPRWFSANQISGPNYGVDVLQLDLAARF